MLVENVTCICNVKSLTSAYKLLAQLMLIIHRRVKIAPAPDIKLIQNSDLPLSEKRKILDKGEGLFGGQQIADAIFGVHVQKLYKSSQPMSRHRNTCKAVKAGSIISRMKQPTLLSCPSADPW